MKYYLLYLDRLFYISIISIINLYFKVNNAREYPFIYD